mmetsp:Transcript_21807/g.59743  ORF Transcript_21807/g.59743 Transcript_21807/m.59743 type:complete len:85 (-) Transcript_21807:189-443(-)
MRTEELGDSVLEEGNGGGMGCGGKGGSGDAVAELGSSGADLTQDHLGSMFQEADQLGQDCGWLWEGLGIGDTLDFRAHLFDPWQ